MKLINMTDFVLEQTELLYDKNQSKLIHNIVNYAQFLKQSLKLEMFVPCDEDGSILSEPKCNHSFDIHGEVVLHHEGCNIKDWNKSKEKVLFEGFELKGEYLMYYDFMYMMKYELEGKIVENLIEEIPNNSLQLTQNAIKKFL